MTKILDFEEFKKNAALEEAKSREKARQEILAEVALMDIQFIEEIQSAPLTDNVYSFDKNKP
jgi:hypothetical protein